MIKKTLIFWTILCVCLSAQTVRSEEQQKSWWISPSAGFSFFGSDHGIKDNPVFAIGAGTKINEHWNFEGTLRYLDTETTGTPRSDLEIYQLAMSLLYDVHPSKRLIPYLLVGGGGFRADSEEYGTKAGGILHYGAGLRYTLSPNLSIKGEVRHQIYIGMIDDEGERKTLQNLTTLVGLNLHFDQARHPVATTLPAPLKKTSTPATHLSEDIIPQDKLSDKDLATVGAGDSRPALPSAPDRTPILTVTPKFNVGGVDILSWPPQDLTILKNFFEDHPQADVIVMGDINENALSYFKYKLQERRAQRVRLFLIDHFKIAPDKVETMTQMSWTRTKKDKATNQALIRFTPIENGTTLANQISGSP